MWGGHTEISLKIRVNFTNESRYTSLLIRNKLLNISDKK